MKRLTPLSVEKLAYQPSKAQPSGRMEQHDSIVRGLVLRISKTGHKSFAIRYKVRGRDARITLGAVELAEAREQATEILRAVAHGRDPRTERLASKANTFASVREQFIERDRKPSVKNWKAAQSTLKLHVEPHWGSWPVSDIRRRDVLKLLQDCAAAGQSSKGMAIRKHLSKFFRWCVDYEYIAASPMPLGKVAGLKQNLDRGHKLADAELKAIWKAAAAEGYPFGPLHQLLILTGQRRNEWAHAKREHIVNRCLVVPKESHKSKRGHVVPLSDAAWAIVEALPRWNGPYLFSTTAGERPVSGHGKVKARMDKAAKLKVKFRPHHDYRVTLRTRMEELGIAPATISEVLGHARTGLSRVYNLHEYKDEKKAALDAYATHIMAIVG